MKAPVTLAITTAGPVAAALVADDLEQARATRSQALDGTLRCVQAVLEASAMKIGDVELIAVCRGPGSFTGLRIGVAFAKSVAQALGLPIVGVSSYDVADFEFAITDYPRAALVEGKRDYYYARICDAADAAPRYVRGTHAEMTTLIKDVDARSLSDVPSAEQALRVAHIGRRSATEGAVLDWRGLDIDYGQRPNAEINWAARGGRAERGGAPSAAKSRDR